MYARTPKTAEPVVTELSLNGSCGYSIHGDKINIDISGISNQRDAGTISGTLSIELWALKQPYEGGYFDGFSLAGTQVGEIYGEHFINPPNFELNFHEPPAGTWNLTLMLREWNGAAYETRDFVNFSAPYLASGKHAVARTESDNVITVSFTETRNVTVPDAEAGNQSLNECTIQSQMTRPVASELRINGMSGYTLQEDQITINVGEVANLRPTGNISGTLSIELWALKQPYGGEGFNGICLAGTRIGEIQGQHAIHSACLDLDFQEPPEGTWCLALMLREWSGTAYETRDFINFAIPYIAEAKPAVGRRDTSNVINVSFGGDKKAVYPVAETVKSAMETSPSLGNESKAKTEEGAASINHADFDELVSIKGLSKKTAENIVANRPFESFDDVLTVKGVGPRLLNMLRKIFSL
ncbi:ComEA family DNA-binding protein [Methylomonas sp. MgM2]